MIRISITLARAWVDGGVGSFPPIQCPGGCLISFRIDTGSFNAALQHAEGGAAADQLAQIIELSVKLGIK